MKILIHVCCGPCSAGLIERLKNEGHEVCVFFYNPNIYPEEEHDRRADNARQVAEHFGADFVNGVSDWKKEHEEWLSAAVVKGLEKEKEGGPRCFACYAYRLKRAAEYAKQNGYCASDRFVSTLPMGPMKDLEKITKMGEEIGKEFNVPYYTENIRKKGSYSRSGELAKELGLYRQDYCGCEFSIRE